MLVIDRYIQLIIGYARGPQVTASDVGAFETHFDEIGGTSKTRIRTEGIKALLEQRSNRIRASLLVRIVESPVSVGQIGFLTANVAYTGEVYTIMVAGFAPNEAVAFLPVAASGGIDRKISVSVANSSGAAQVEAVIPVASGIYSMEAVCSQGATAIAELLVVN